MEKQKAAIIRCRSAILGDGKRRMTYFRPSPDRLVDILIWQCKFRGPVYRWYDLYCQVAASMSLFSQFDKGLPAYSQVVGQVQKTSALGEGVVTKSDLSI